MTTVVVIGPNLLDQSKGDMHVHAFGCKDLTRGQYRHFHEDANRPVQAGSEKDVVLYVYDPDNFGFDADIEWESYADGIAFFPCVKF